MDSKQEALVDKFDARLEQTEARMAMLRARAKEASADRRVELNEQIEKLEARKQSAKARIEELRRSSGQAWDDIAEGAESAWKSLKSALDRAVDRF